MAKIPLRTYNREIDGLIEQGGRLDEAIAHCRHILKTYPKYLETYRRLGKAYLEAKRYDQAVDIFQRILVAAPDDFVSHVGMSIIADDKGKLDDAIWHMERAFEVQPSNAAIQGELQRLFGRRDGVEPPKIRLTRGALAHMYVQGELYTQAISEIRAVLANDAKRTDMKTLLARAYFRNGQKAEATDLCTELLSHYPYCLDANRLMVEILPGTQRADAAQEYRQRVIELDPYAAFVQDSIFNSDGAADSAVTIDRLDYRGEPAEGPAALGIGLETDTTLVSRSAAPAPAAPPAPAASADLPSWLRGTAAGDSVPSTPAESASPQEKEVPDFLRKAGWDATSGSAAQQEPSAFAAEAGSAADAAVEGELPDWVKALAPAEPQGEEPEPTSPPLSTESLPSMQRAASADTPDWLRNLGAEQSEEPAAATPQAPEPAPGTPDWLRDLSASAESGMAAPPAEASEETPDWLKKLGGGELDEPVAPAAPAAEPDWLGNLRAEQPAAPQEAPTEESPDWLKEFSNDLETPIPKPPNQQTRELKPKDLEPSPSLGALGTTAQEQDDAMAWLEGLAAKHGAKPEELVTDPNARTEVAPGWVDKAKEIGEKTGTTGPLHPMDETGIWLQGLAAEPSGAAQEVPQPPVEQPADFRTAFTDQTGFATEEAQPGKEETSIMGEAETPDWLGEFTTKPVERAELESAPDWLRGGLAEEPAAQPTAPEEGAVAPEVAAQAAPVEAPQGEGADLPAWLAGLDNEEPAVSTQPAGSQPSEELPAWLQAEAEPEPEAKQPANPADWRPVIQPEPFDQTPTRAETKPVSEKPSPPPVAPRPRESAPAATPAPMRPRPPAVPNRGGTGSLGDAQSQLGRGNIAAALDIYGKLIRKGKSLEDIIRDLRDALYRYPVEVPLWQSLGDAYMRANRLQEALDAYTKAEELLR